MEWLKEQIVRSVQVDLPDQDDCVSALRQGFRLLREGLQQEAFVPVGGGLRIPRPSFEGTWAFNRLRSVGEEENVAVEGPYQIRFLWSFVYLSYKLSWSRTALITGWTSLKFGCALAWNLPTYSTWLLRGYSDLLQHTAIGQWEVSVVRLPQQLIRWKLGITSHCTIDALTSTNKLLITQCSANTLISSSRLLVITRDTCTPNI